MKGQIRTFPRSFWLANSMELLERWAWYGFFVLFANYLTASSDVGGLEFTQIQKANIMSIGTGILYFLPILTGAIADRFGYKKVLLFAFLIYVSAFLLLPAFDTYKSVFLLYIYLAVGAALFKPIVSATVAKTTNEKNSSLGFGIFYLMVNLGAFIGPLITLLFKQSSYDKVFFASAFVIALNFILVLFYKEPLQEKVKTNLGKTFAQIFKNILTVILDYKFLIFLLIVGGFWAMYFQLFYTLPVFIAQWVDTGVIYRFFAEHFPFVAHHYGSNNMQMEAEFIVNFDAMFIILLQIFISILVKKWRPLQSMFWGFLVCSIGMALTLLTQNVIYTIVSILIFSVGEMAGSPKITEYIGRIAPANKKALYIGFSFLPVFFGNLMAGVISGSVYENMSDKTQLVYKEAVEQKVSVPESVSLNEQFTFLAQKMQLSEIELTNYLWQKYQPYKIWVVVLSVGLIAAFCLFFYDLWVKKSRRKLKTD